MIEEKIKTREELQTLCNQFRSDGQKIGFTSGAFDILHAGHTDYLQKAKALCDILIVGVNTDASIRKYKGPDRPIIDEKYRLLLVAALESVDFVFLFDERRNQKNIEALRPLFYIKAGDYSPETLTSKEVVEKYGGEVRLIPVAEPISTTQIIARLSNAMESGHSRFIEEENTGHFERRPVKQSPAVFLDRDGTINEEILYLSEPEKFKILPNALEGIRKFQDMGFRIVILTNQPGIGLGYFSKEQFYAVNREMLRQFSRAGILVDKIYFCPHSKSEQCDCRKPGLALVKRAEEELNLDLSRSVFIGDKTSDIETGKRAGARTLLVQSGFRGEDGEFDVTPKGKAIDLLEAAEVVLVWERS
jgi:D-glycero-D-manno-heptose 1,7-bisphosphate phosphatase